MFFNIANISGRRRNRLHRKQLRRRTHQALRIQETERQDSEDGGFRLPRRRIGRRVQRAVPELSLQMPLIRLRRHRRDGLQIEPSLQSHLDRHSSKLVVDDEKNLSETCGRLTETKQEHIELIRLEC